MTLDPRTPQMYGDPARWGERQYYLGNRLLGVAIEYAVKTNGDKWGCKSHEAFCCPTCGEIWGRTMWAPQPGWNGPLLGWTFTKRYCPKHGNGSLFTSLHEVFNSQSSPLLAHEIRVLSSPSFKGDYLYSTPFLVSNHFRKEPV